MSVALRLSDTVWVLDSLRGLPIVLIGGQAVNYWADHYSSRCPELAAEGPFASKDIDFQGNREQVERCAVLLHGEAHLPKADDMTPQAGTVVLDNGGRKLEVDFLQYAYGLTAEETYLGSVPVQVLDKSGVFVPVKVMSPFHCLKSRVRNVLDLDGYQSEHGKRQLRAAVVVAREFTADLAEHNVRKALDQNEAVFRFVLSRPGRTLYRRFRLDIFPAVARTPAFPPPFRNERYPRMQALWLNRRGKPSDAR